ncbi:hypothetical protein CBS101457_003252 [Exobasidium rhododendri]|nr:hypothetical protein CBS101457_003252 [Exobasidium rhododendri]
MPQLLNTLVSKAQVETSFSRQDGVPADLEDELRVYGCQLIQQAGILLELPQVTMATAQVLFQRFWYVTSMKQFGIKDIAMGVLFLASKLEESPVRLRDLINVFDYLLQRGLHYSRYNPGPRSEELEKARKSSNKDQDAIPPFDYTPQAYFSQSFYDTKDALVISEMQILKRLGFQVQVNLPYATMVNYLQLLGLTKSESGIAQRAWAILNDALQTPVYVMFPTHVLAAASIYLISVTLDDFPSLPLTPKPWWTLFDVTREELRIVGSHIMKLYDTEEGGLAARVRDEWGGMSEFCEKIAIRDWLSRFGEEVPV